MNRHLLRVSAIALAILSAPFAAHAQSAYPNQSIRFIVPYAAGGLPDTVARITAQHLQERLVRRRQCPSPVDGGREGRAESADDPRPLSRHRPVRAGAAWRSRAGVVLG